MKIRIVRTVDSADHCVDGDSDTICTAGEAALRPIRLLADPAPAPSPPTDSEVEQAFASRKANVYFNEIIVGLRDAFRSVEVNRPRTIRYLIYAFKCDEEAARTLSHKSCDEVIQAYINAKKQELREQLEIPWRQRIDAWETYETSRKASLRLWLFRGKVVEVDGWESSSREEIETRVQHKVLKDERAIERMRRDIEVSTNVNTGGGSRRESIPERVRIIVWRRDGHKCVKCGSEERLEFDHIIPVARGGSSTARNIQLLCERCNRAKGSTI